MHLGIIGVADPPQIQPVGIDLMICNHDDAVGKVELDTAVLGAPDLASNGVVATDAYGGGAPDFGHGDDEETKGFFCQSHVGVVEFAVDPIQGRADELRDVDGYAAGDEIGKEAEASCELREATLLDPAGRMRDLVGVIVGRVEGRRKLWGGQLLGRGLWPLAQVGGHVGEYLGRVRQIGWTG